MKLNKKIVIGLAFSVATFSALAGKHSDGWINVSVYEQTSTLIGQMNVRFNPSSYTSSAFMDATYNTRDKGVSFFAYDASRKKYFACGVAINSSLYDEALNIQSNLRNGSRLYITKNNSSNECTYIHYMNASNMID